MLTDHDIRDLEHAKATIERILARDARTRQSAPVAAQQEALPGILEEPRTRPARELTREQRFAYVRDGHRIWREEGGDRVALVAWEEEDGPILGRVAYRYYGQPHNFNITLRDFLEKFAPELPDGLSTDDHEALDALEVPVPADGPSLGELARNLTEAEATLVANIAAHTGRTPTVRTRIADDRIDAVVIAYQLRTGDPAEWVERTYERDTETSNSRHQDIIKHALRDVLRTIAQDHRKD